MRPIHLDIYLYDSGIAWSLKQLNDALHARERGLIIWERKGRQPIPPDLDSIGQVIEIVFSAVLEAIREAPTD